MNNLLVGAGWVVGTAVVIGGVAEAIHLINKAEDAEARKLQAPPPTGAVVGDILAVSPDWNGSTSADGQLRLGRQLIGHSFDTRADAAVAASQLGSGIHAVVGRAGGDDRKYYVFDVRGDASKLIPDASGNVKGQIDYTTMSDSLWGDNRGHLFDSWISRSEVSLQHGNQLYDTELTPAQQGEDYVSEYPGFTLLQSPGKDGDIDHSPVHSFHVTTP
jgi:hypothetical protein